MRLDIEHSERIFGISPNILDVDRPTLERGPRRDRMPSGPDRVTRYELLVLWRHVVGGRHTNEIAIVSVDESPFRFAQPRRRFSERIEHRLQVKGRAADDLEHVGGGRLLLQRFAQFVEQAGVLDGDDGLGGEIAQQARSACR